MRVMRVNRRNIASLYGKIKNSFKDRNLSEFMATGVEVFHNFNCGFHKISPILEDLPGKPDVTREYPDVNASNVILRSCSLNRMVRRMHERRI